jgi:hypothetical protein
MFLFFTFSLAFFSKVLYGADFVRLSVSMQKNLVGNFSFCAVYQIWHRLFEEKKTAQYWLEKNSNTYHREHNFIHQGKKLWLVIKLKKKKYIMIFIFHNKMKNKKYYTVRTLPKYYTVSILEVFWQYSILEVFWQYSILEVFWQYSILEVFRQYSILEVFQSNRKTKNTILMEHLQNLIEKQKILYCWNTSKILYCRNTSKI